MTGFIPEVREDRAGTEVEEGKCETLEVTSLDWRKGPGVASCV